jgi:hypothetical protein
VDGGLASLSVDQSCSLETMDATSSSCPTRVSESQEQTPFEMLEKHPQISVPSMADSQKNRRRIGGSSQRSSKKVRFSTTDTSCQHSAEKQDIGKMLILSSVA